MRGNNNEYLFGKSLYKFILVFCIVNLAALADPEGGVGGARFFLVRGAVTGDPIGAEGAGAPWRSLGVQGDPPVI